MAATYTVTKNFVAGSVRIGVVEVTLDSSYPTGGEAVALATALSWEQLIEVIAIRSSSANGYVPQWDGDNIVIYETGTTDAALDEINNASDLSAETITVTCIGV